MAKTEIAKDVNDRPNSYLGIMDNGSRTISITTTKQAIDNGGIR